MISASVVDMDIQGIVTSIQLAAGKPAKKGSVRIVEHPVPFFIPVAILRGLAPETVGVVYGLLVCDFIRVGHLNPPSLNQPITM